MIPFHWKSIRNNTEISYSQVSFIAKSKVFTICTAYDIKIKKVSVSPLKDFLGVCYNAEYCLNSPCLYSGPFPIFRLLCDCFAFRLFSGEFSVVPLEPHGEVCLSGSPSSPQEAPLSGHRLTADPLQAGDSPVQFTWTECLISP